MKATTTPGHKFTERDLITMLDVQRDYLASLVKTNAPQRARGIAQAAIDATRRKLWNREFIGA